MNCLWIYLIGYFVCVVISIGWLFANAQHGYSDAFNKEWKRTDLGMSVMFSFIFMLVWPVGLPIIFCVTGFAEHGWRLK